MFRRAVLVCIIFIFLISLSGCATTRKQKDLEIQGLRNQISALEIQLENKDAEIDNLREALNIAMETREAAFRKKVVSEVKSRPTVKHIQTALKNAGYDPGPIDGRMGKQTRSAIKAFQRDNKLAVDAKVGKQTWGLLRKYLDKKVK